MLGARYGGPGEIFGILKEIQHVNVPMMWSQGGSRNIDGRFCLDVQQQLKVSNYDFD